MARKNQNLIGAWAFLIGVILAIAVGLFKGFLTSAGAVPTVYVILAVLGLLVGLLNVTTKDVSTFLFASVSLVIVSYMAQSVMGAEVLKLQIISLLQAIFSALMLLFVPATIVVALKAVFAVAKA